MRKITSLILALTVLALAPIGAFAAIGDLFGVTRNGGQIHQINPATGALISSVSITGVGSVSGANGLTSDPISGLMYGLLRVGNARQLATINPHTGAAALIGNPGGSGWAALAFDSSGTLYGLTGDGAGGGNVPESLYTLSTIDSTATFVRTFGTGNDGEAMAFNSNDGLLYRQSGFGAPNVDEIFESYNITTDSVSPIALSGYDYLETTALTYDEANGVFLGSDLGREFYSITTGGVVTLLGTNVTSNIYKGLAFEVVPAPGAALLGIMGLSLVGSVRRRGA